MSNKLVDGLIRVKAPSVAFSANEIKCNVIDLYIFLTWIDQFGEQEPLKLRRFDAGSHLDVLRRKRATHHKGFVMLYDELAVGVYLFNTNLIWNGSFDFRQFLMSNFAII